MSFLSCCWRWNHDVPGLLSGEVRAARRTAARFVEAYLQAEPEAVVDYLLAHSSDGVRGALISAATAFQHTGQAHCNALVALFQEGRAALIYERLAADLPELPEPFTGLQNYDTDWAVDRRDLINWVK